MLILLIREVGLTLHFWCLFKFPLTKFYTFPSPQFLLCCPVFCVDTFVIESNDPVYFCISIVTALFISESIELGFSLFCT